MLYQVVTGFEPYYDNDMVDMLKIQVPNGLQPSFKDWQHRGGPEGQQLVGLMKRCWALNPTERPSMGVVFGELRQMLQGSVGE